MREEDVLWPPQLGRSINPSSIEGFFPSLSAIGTAYGRDLCPKGILGLSHVDVVPMLLGFFFLHLSLGFSLFCFSLGFSLFCFSLGFFSLISEPLSFL